MNPHMTVLVVDDFSVMRRIIKSLLREIGVACIFEAEDGKEALEILADGCIDFVVTDWHMPNMNGLELVQAIRANPDTYNLPVLMVTAESKKKHIFEAAHAGINGYIIKPFAPDELKSKMAGIVNRIDNNYLQPTG